MSTVAAFNNCQAADSRDNTGAPVSYSPSNAADGKPATAWRCLGHPPLGGRYGLTFTLATTAHVSTVGAIGGYAKNDPLNPDIDRFIQNDRVFNARWTCTRRDDTTLETQQRFDDSRAMQTTSVDWAGCMRIDFEILDVYPAVAQFPAAGSQPPMDDTMVSEVSLIGWAGG